MRALSELEKFGYLHRLRVVNEKGQFNGVEYNIYEKPQQQKPTAAKQPAAKQSAANPTTEKQQLLNTNSINNLKNKKLINKSNIADLKKFYNLE